MYLQDSSVREGVKQTYCHLTEVSLRPRMSLHTLHASEEVRVHCSR